MATAPVVLLADDNEDSRLILRAILEDRGSRVIETADGVACLEVARDRQPDVIVLDLAMPRLDGWAAAETLTTDPRTTSIPILAYTACSLPEDHQRALDAGCKLVLLKPSAPKDVADAVEALHAWHTEYAAESSAAREESAWLRALASSSREESQGIRARTGATRADPGDAGARDAPER